MAAKLNRILSIGGMLFAVLLSATLCRAAADVGTGRCWIRDVAPVGPGAAYVLCEQGLVYETLDGGTSWTAHIAARDIEARAISFLDARHGFIAGSGGSLLETTDGGAHWNLVTSGTTSDLNGLVFVGEQGWAVGTKGTILHTADGGRTWSPQHSFLYDTLDGVFFLDAQHGWAVGWNGTILRTTDGGAFWEGHSVDGVYLPLNSVSFADVSNGWVVGATNLALRTADGGNNWTKLTLPAVGFFTSVSVTRDGRVFVAGDKLLVSADQGRSWQALPWKSDDVATTVSKVTVEGDVLWAVGPQAVLNSTDGGRTWLARDTFLATTPIASGTAGESKSGERGPNPR